MKSYDLVFCGLYIILGSLNLFGILKLSDVAILGITIGSLWLGFIPLVKNINSKRFLLLIGLFFIIGFQHIENSENLLVGIDMNTFMLVSLALIFFSSYKSKVDLETKELEEKKTRVELNKKIKEILEENERLKNNKV